MSLNLIYNHELWKPSSDFGKWNICKVMNVPWNYILTVKTNKKKTTWVWPARPNCQAKAPITAATPRDLTEDAATSGLPCDLPQRLKGAFVSDVCVSWTHDIKIEVSWCLCPNGSLWAAFKQHPKENESNVAELQRSVLSNSFYILAWNEKVNTFLLWSLLN